MKFDEKQLLKELARLQASDHRTGADAFATDVGRRLGVHGKRTEYILDKWIGKKWWDCGVTLRSGWLTELGMAEANRGDLPLPS